ncbi:MAG TPA: cytochrome c oxidase subunit II, partial [Solirubrobacteraceae bacterium]|nr:cytochrome c oxidase subunit II [Solirubrobacteraceae bacterium]
MTPRAQPSRRRRLIGLVTLSVLGIGALGAPVAWAGTFLPQSGGSPNADRISTLYEIALYMAIVIFIVVEGALVYSLVKFRARRHVVPAQIRGNTRLELAWTVGAALILVVLAVITFVTLSAIRIPDNSGPGGYRLASSGALFATTDRQLPPNGKSLNIQVNGQQFLWRYTYPGGGANGLGAPYSYEEMVVPTDTTVTLDIVSQDVAHSWWIPELGGKADAVPGHTNFDWFKISKPGVFRGQCAELCGRNHADMVAKVVAVEPAQFKQWLANKKREIEAA